MIAMAYYSWTQISRYTINYFWFGMISGKYDYQNIYFLNYSYYLSRLHKRSKFSILPILPWLRSSSSVCSLTTISSWVSSLPGGGVIGGGGDEEWFISESSLIWSSLFTSSVCLFMIGVSWLPTNYKYYKTKTL